MEKQQLDVDADGIPMPKEFESEIDKSDLKTTGSRMIGRGEYHDLFKIFLEVLNGK